MTEEPERQRREVKHEYSEIRTAALHMLSNKPVIEVIAAAITYPQIWEQLQTLVPDGKRDWSKPSSVVTAVKTAADRAQTRLPVGQRLRPQAWLAEDLAFEVEAIDLQLRTSDESAKPIVALIDSVRNDRRAWPDGIEETASQVFLNALKAVDPSTDLRRVDLLPFRSSENSGRRLQDILEQHPEIDAQVEAYWKMCDELLEVYGRRLVSSAEVPYVLELLAALEDGFLARAAGMGSKYEERFAESFARGVLVILEGATTDTLD